MATCNVHGTKRTPPTSLPSEIVTDEILPKLPAKSLVRFKCVSKSFNTLISSPEFIDVQLRQSLSSDTNRLLIIAGKDNWNLYSVDADSPEPSTAVNIPLPRTFREWLSGDVSIVGSFNGLLCLVLTLQLRISKHTVQVLINPCTGVYREIPHMGIPYEGYELRVSFGFGFDDTEHDYKLVRIVENAELYCPDGDVVLGREVRVYSLKDDQWKFVKYRDRPNDSLDSRQNGVLMKNHLLHWLFWGSDEKYRIFCFDVRSEKWANEVPLMDLFTSYEACFDDEYKDKLVTVHKLGVLHGCLCLSTSTISSEVVWIMKEYGVKESWVKLFEISPSCDPWSLCICPFGFRQGSKHLEILVRDLFKSGIYWCDIGSHTFGRTEIIKGVPDFKNACFFKGSLIPIPGGQQQIEASLDEQETSEEDYVSILGCEG